MTGLVAMLHAFQLTLVQDPDAGRRLCIEAGNPSPVFLNSIALLQNSCPSTKSDESLC